ncbi:MAG: peptidylprolyl isomerase [Candidatus Competibacteraceae bacterium]
MIKLHTQFGVIGIELDHAKAPATAANFLQYAREGFYDGTLFHRVIPNFVIQGGGLEPGLVQKSTRAPIRNEADNGLRNLAGTVAMARTADPHSATAQFFINLKDNDFLDHTAPTSQGWGYCVFGRVIEGQEVIAAIANAPTTARRGHQDVPVDDIVVEKTEVIDE